MATVFYWTYTYLQIPLGIIGTIGAVLTCMTFWHAEFKGPSFIYHKAVSVHEIFQMLLLLANSLIEFLGRPGDAVFSFDYIGKPGWFWYSGTFNGMMIIEMTKTAIIFIALFICIERCVALWMPVNSI